jgi:hypothetical protein
MASPLPDLSEPVWTSKLVTVLERAASSIGRLDARVSVSPVAAPWSLRASWTGYATALRGQSAEIDEIDIFSRECGVKLPGRPAMPTHVDDPDSLPAWQGRLRQREAHYWRDVAAIPTDVAEDWNRRPALLRALEVVARHAREDATITPWLTVPALLRSMNITHAMLPCLTIADKAFRLAPRESQAIIVRNLRTLADRAEDGILRLQALEDHRLRAAAGIWDAHRPGKLLELVALVQFAPVVSPRLVAQKLGVTLSGAGKLLMRAADLELLTEVSGRRAWRTYMAPDLAVAFGYASRPVGRPPSPPRQLPDLEPALSAFDREMAEVDVMLARYSGPLIAEHADRSARVDGLCGPNHYRRHDGAAPSPHFYSQNQESQNPPQA